MVALLAVDNDVSSELSSTWCTTESVTSSAAESVNKKPIKRNLIERNCHLLLLVILENVLLRKKRKCTNVYESLNKVVDKLVKQGEYCDDDDNKKN